MGSKPTVAERSSKKARRSKSKEDIRFNRKDDMEEDGEGTTAMETRGEEKDEEENLSSPSALSSETSRRPGITSQTVLPLLSPHVVGIAVRP